jgi:calcineurin-like phosphoesterase
MNFQEGTPGRGFEVYEKNGFKVGVMNLMGNVYMKKCEDVFPFIQEKIKKINLKKEVDFLAVDFHAEITSEKQAMGHLLDGKATFVVGTHTHTPTLDFRILEHGTAYQTDAGMCGDYNSVIGMNKENAILKFFKRKTDRLIPVIKNPTISGIKVIADDKTGLAKDIEPIMIGGNLKFSKN